MLSSLALTHRMLGACMLHPPAPLRPPIPSHVGSPCPLYTYVPPLLLCLQVAVEVTLMQQQSGVTPGLAVVLVGSRKDSET